MAASRRVGWLPVWRLAVDQRHCAPVGTFTNKVRLPSRGVTFVRRQPALAFNLLTNPPLAVLVRLGGVFAHRTTVSFVILSAKGAAKTSLVHARLPSYDRGRHEAVGA